MNWLEIARLSVSLTTPIAVVIIGYILNNRLKEIDNIQWHNRKIIEKRIEIYDKVAPDINKIFCFLMWIGYWKEITPPSLIESKRNLDKAFNVNRYLISEDAYRKYNAFIHSAFQTYTGVGEDAKIKSLITSNDGDRRKDLQSPWDSKWDYLFLENSAESREIISNKYKLLMQALTSGFSLEGGRR